MKCTICGCEIPADSDICTNCGTKVSEMMKKSPEVNSIPVGGGISRLNTAEAKRNEKRHTINFIIVLVLIALLGIFYFLYSNVLTKTIDEGAFTAKIPVTMKESKDNETLELDEENAVGKVYSNSKSDFSFLTMDLSSLEETVKDSVNEKYFLDLMETELKHGSVFKKCEIVSYENNVIECNITNNQDVEMYAKISCKKGNNKLVLIFVDCNQKYKSKLGSKMDKWIDSVVVK